MLSRKLVMDTKGYVHVHPPEKNFSSKHVV